MADEVTERHEYHVGEHAASNVVMPPAQPTKSMGLLQWVAVVGIGSALIAWLVPKMWEQQVRMTEKMLENGEKTATAMQSTADAIEDIGEDFEQGFDKLIVKGERDSRDLQRIVRNMEKVAVAVQATLEDDREETAEAEEPPNQ